MHTTIHKPHLSPHYDGVGQSRVFIASAAWAGLDKMKAKKYDGKTQAMPTKAWGKLQSRLNCTTRSDPPNFYCSTTQLQQREGG